MAGSQAIFRFKGSFVEVFGTIGHGLDAPVSTYRLDGLPSVTFKPAIPNGTIYRQLYYKSTTLNDEQHILVITSIVSNTVFWLDYFQITPPPPTPSTIATTSSISRSDPMVQPLSSVADVPQAKYTSSSVLGNGSLSLGYSSQTPVKSSATSTTHNVPIGMIVGSVIGGVVLVFLVLTLLYQWKRRSRKGASTLSVEPYEFANINREHLICLENQERGDMKFRWLY
ncbi:hypothetical protein BDZ94DRAFT_265027 [Collybia nuda]|uniref:Uncharacterized protein n=1 Tax=Collybia nuda TaxID=64659 RepID=A0A9P5XV45_9AGAR|nr:hypothetical protein BDZ94DRAFT_265027 [Collybia nuda]